MAIKHVLKTININIEHCFQSTKQIMNNSISLVVDVSRYEHSSLFYKPMWISFYKVPGFCKKNFDLLIISSGEL